MPSPPSPQGRRRDHIALVGGPLAADQLVTYRRSGWLLVRGFVSKPEVDAIARWTDDLLALPEEPGKHMAYYESKPSKDGERLIQRIENFCPYHPEFDAFVNRSRLREAVDQLFGEPSCLFKEKINFKMPGGAGFEPHPDQQAGWSRYASIFITALVTIDTATAENGCLEMAEGRRIAGLIGEEWRPLSVTELGACPLVPVPTKPGDVLFFDSYAPHASKPNLTDRPRRILYLTYNAASEGDHRARYYVDKRQSFPPDIERLPGVDYKFRV
jgi:2-aminoethylphosphonate dioxygenase